MTNEKDSINKRFVYTTIIGIVIVMAILTVSTIWASRKTLSATDEAVSAVSSFYLEAMVDQRARTITNLINNNFDHMYKALTVIEETDIKSQEELRNTLGWIKMVLSLNRFALVDEDNIVYTQYTTYEGGSRYEFLSEEKLDKGGYIYTAGSNDGGAKSVSNCLYIQQDGQKTDNLDLVKYGTTPSSDLAVFGEMEECAPFLSFSWKNQSAGSNAPVHNVNTHLIGSYNIYNMLAAATIGLHFGVSDEQVDHALANYIPSNNRSQLTITSSNKLIVDTYNANPTSMNAALLNFRDMKVSPKMAILGDMRELGEVSAEEHQKVVDFLKQTDITNVWLVGSEFANTDCDYRKFDDVDQVKEEIAANPPKDEYILIKGSNGIKLFQLPELL